VGHAEKEGKLGLRPPKPISNAENPPPADRLINGPFIKPLLIEPWTSVQGRGHCPDHTHIEQPFSDLLPVGGRGLCAFGHEPEGRLSGLRLPGALLFPAVGGNLQDAKKLAKIRLRPAERVPEAGEFLFEEARRLDGGSITPRIFRSLVARATLSGWHLDGYGSGP
jgi:hypothetical protein